MTTTAQATRLSIAARLATAAGACCITLVLLQSMLAMAEPQRSQLAATRQAAPASTPMAAAESQPLELAAR